jgi:N-acetylglucosamine malate deacetylase 1
MSTDIEGYPNLPEVHEALDVLVVAPHPDDAELGMGGAIRKLIQQGKRVGIVDLTDGEPTPFGNAEIRAAETIKASSALGLAWRYNLGMKNRYLESSLDNRHRLAGLFRLARPRWIFAPYWVDSHPDHVAATELVEASRFWSKLSKSTLPGEPFHPDRIFYYFCIHLKMIPQPAFILDISEQWPAKAASIDAYQSQFVAGRSIDPPSFLERFREEAAFWGRSIGVRYGEPFASREPVGIQHFESLI